MINIRRACLVLILSLAAIFVPSSGWCVKVDPYAHTNIVGSVFYDYSHEKRTANDRNSTQSDEITSSFGQNYDFTLYGNAISRLLMIYDVNVRYDRRSENFDILSANSTDTTDTTFNSLFLDVNTTLIPRSRIPLTLFGSRDTSWSTINGSSAPSTNITTIGFAWSGKFVTLPVMSLTVERQYADRGGTGGSDKTISIQYRADKEYGPTKNTLTYDIDLDTLNTGESLRSSAITFGNSTQLSRHSVFGLDVLRSNLENTQTNSRQEKRFNVDMSLLSDPSRFFHQSHRLHHESTDIVETRSTRTSYDGALDYHVSKKVNLNLKLNVSKDLSESPTTSRDDTRTRASSTFAYNLTDHLSVSEGFMLALVESSSSNPANRNLTDGKSLSTNTNLNYYRTFSRFKFRSSYGLGYILNTRFNKESVDNNDIGGQGITHNGSLHFNRIDFNRFFFFDVGGSFFAVLKSTSGQVKEKNSNYNISFDSRFWQKYISVNGSYEKENSTVAHENLKNTSEDAIFTVRTNPIKGISGEFELERRVLFDEITGFDRSNTGDISAHYTRKIFKGNLNADLGYNITMTTFRTGSNKSRLIYSNLSYSRPILRRMTWVVRTRYDDFTVEDTFSRHFEVGNDLTYQLRAWRFSMNHTYSITNSSSTDYTDNRIYFSASRKFARIFY